MILFCLKSYNIVALYENSDDDYASKMGKSAVAFIPEVTISESEIAELEQPKVKEVKPKDIEGEKPKVSKVDKDMYLVQFYSGAEVGFGRSLKYWTTFDEANGISTID